DSNPRFKTLRDLFQHLPLSDIVDVWKEGKESINECANILLNKVKSTSDVQQLQVQCASFLESDIHDGDDDDGDDDDGDDDVDEDKKYSNVNTKINSLIDVGILKEVQFVAESAIDEGGPRCELFCLVDRMVSNELMQGEDGQKTFLHNMVLLQKNEYHLYRQCVAMALLQGSPGPQVHPSKSEVLDYEVRKKLEELEAITNPEMFVQEASFNFPERFSAGYCNLVVNDEDKEELIRYGLFTMWFRAIFQPVLSPVGNINRDHEEAILVNFNHFFEEVEYGLVHYVGDKNDLLFNPWKTSLQWVSALLLKIVFAHEAPVGRKMTANTCANAITFPVNNIYMEYELFKNEMISCIQDCQGL
ncbi:unnamed protein product, partial [Pocillopora meandrina]